MLDMLWYLISVQDWVKDVIARRHSKIYWIRYPTWAFRSESVLSGKLYEAFGISDEEFPIILDLSREQGEGASEFLAFRKALCPVERKCKDIDAIVRHELTSKRIIVNHMYQMASDESRERWGRLFVRWIRLANEHNLRRQIFVLYPKSYRLPRRIKREEEQFNEEISWDPPFSITEVRMLLDGYLSPRYNALDRMWTTSIVSSICGLDLCCAQFLLENIRAPEDMVNTSLLTSTLEGYANEIPDRKRVEPMPGFLSLIEPHPIELLGDKTLLEQRIWRGQVSWMFSIVDHVRLWAATYLKGISHYPCKEKCISFHGEENQESEFGCLACLAKSNGSIKLSNLLYKAKRVRNELAHYRIVPYVDAAYLWRTASELNVGEETFGF